MAPSIRAYRKRIANIIINAATLRNTGASGVVDIARKFLAALDLAQFVGGPTPFTDELNKQTKNLKFSFPKAAQHWGTSRKALNLFLAESYYHRYVCSHYGLERIASLLEVPLDSQVATWLINQARRQGKELPAWKSIKCLEPEQSEIYQKFAQEYISCLNSNATDEGRWLRVHLDVKIWRPVNVVPWMTRVAGR